MKTERLKRVLYWLGLNHDPRCGHERWDDATSKWVRCAERAGHWRKS